MFTKVGDVLNNLFEGDDGEELIVRGHLTKEEFSGYIAESMEEAKDILAVVPKWARWVPADCNGEEALHLYLYDAPSRGTFAVTVGVAAYYKKGN